MVTNFKFKIVYCRWLYEFTIIIVCLTKYTLKEVLINTLTVYNYRLLTYCEIFPSDDALKEIFHKMTQYLLSF